MAFPRYRIDLSSEKAAKKRFNAVKSGLSLFSGIKQGLDKATVERRYTEEARDGRLFFVDCSVDATTLQKAKGNDVGTKEYSNTKGDVSDEDWRTGLAGLRAASQFWKIIADISEVDISSAQPNQKAVISFIGATPLQIQRLIDIASWFEDNMAGDHSHLRIDTDGEMPMPTIVIESRAISRASDEAQVGESDSYDLPSGDIIEARINCRFCSSRQVAPRLCQS